MKIEEIYAAAKAGNPKLFEKVSDPIATRIVKTVLKEILTQVHATRDGKVEVAGFGKFSVKAVDAKEAAEGKEAKAEKLRIRFRPSGLAAKNGEAKAGKKAGKAAKGAGGDKKKKRLAAATPGAAASAA